MKQEELAREKQEKLDKLIQLLLEIPESNAQSVADSIKNKIGLLKACYDKSESHHKEKIHELITYKQLRCFLTGEIYSNTRGSKKIELKDVIYSVDSIRKHIKKKKLPEESSWKAIEIYSFYFGGYRKFFSCFTKKFLGETIKLDDSFLKDIFPYSKLENNEIDTYSTSTQIPGAKIIHKEFVDTIIRSGKKFSAAQFYTAKTYDDCQWYGIIKGYDVERKYYNELYQVLSNSFNNHKDHKVCAVVTGDGGSGKSVLLRKLAFTLHDKNEFEVLWLNDSQFEDFIENGLSRIEQQKNKNFLLFIEDWYRITAGHEKLARKFLKQSLTISNIRIVIGDRMALGKEYENYLSGRIIRLTSDENEGIIAKIVQKNPVWESVFKRLFVNEINYKCTLFQLLFIIARSTEKKSGLEKIDLQDPQRAFVNIIKSDLKSIPKEYEGLRKAIYYWSCIYNSYRCFISYKTFLAIADHFNGNKEISTNFSNWNTKSFTLDKIKIYLNRHNKTDVHFKVDFIQFHHDILADIGISQINYKTPFDDIILRQVLGVIIESGDDTSASLFLGTILKNEKHLLAKREKLAYIEKLIHKKNEHYSYINNLVNILETQDEWHKFGKLLEFNINTHRSHFWAYFSKKCSSEVRDQYIQKYVVKNTAYDSRLKRIFLDVCDWQTQKEFSNKLLQQFINSKSFNSITFEQQDLLAFALNRFKKTPLAEKTYEKILNAVLAYNNYSQEGMHPTIFYNALNFPKNSKLGDQTSQLIIDSNLNHTFMEQINSLSKIISKVLLIHFESNKLVQQKNKVFDAILNSVNETPWQNIFIKKDIIIITLNQTTNITLREKICARVFNIIKNYTSWEENIIDNEIICTVLDCSSNIELREEVCTKILSIVDSYDSWEQNDVDQKVVSLVIYLTLNTELRDKLCNKILSSIDIDYSWGRVGLNKVIISAVLNETSNEELQKNVCDSILQIVKVSDSWSHILIPTELICTVLKLSESSSSTLLQEVCTKIITHKQSGEKINDMIIAIALRLNNNSDDVITYLKNWRKTNWGSVYNALKLFETNYTLPEQVTDVIDQIIVDFKKNNIRIPFTNLMRIGFHQCKVWKNASVEILEQWNTKEKYNNRSYITNVLFSYQTQPQLTEKACKIILENWEKEIIFPIPIFGKREFHFGDHIKIALSHPNLQELALKTANEIIENKNKTNIPNFLKFCAQEIASK